MANSGTNAGGDPRQGEAQPPPNSQSIGKAGSQRELRGRGRRRWRYIIPVVVALAIGAGYLAYWYTTLRGYVSTDDAFVDSHDIVISSKILGRVDSLMTFEGDTVNAGQLLVVLDDRELQAQLAQAQAEVEVARRSVTVEQAALTLAEEDFARAQTQFDQRVVSREQYQHAQNALQMARARLAMAQAQLTAAQARVAVIRSQIDQTRLFAPSWGVIAQKWVVPGDVVQPGSPILTYYNLRDVWITANLEETKVRKLRLGNAARVDLDAYPQTFKGEVSLIGAAAASEFALIPPNNASGNFTKVTQRIPVRIHLRQLENGPPPDGPGLLPGMSATVRIAVRGRS